MTTEVDHASYKRLRGKPQWLSGKEVVDNVATFLMVGSDSIGAALGWALYLVAQHPDVEERLHAEVDTVLAGRDATYDDLPRLELTPVIHEAVS